MAISRNKVVSLRYVLRDQRGEIFEYRDLPVSYVHGSGAQLFAKIELALEGQDVGDSVVIELAPREAFGAHDPGLTFTDAIENVPPELHRVGAEFEARNDRGESRIFRVTRIDGDRLTVDANHPLAGQTVTFEVTATGIREATPQEVANGRPDSPYGPPLQ